MNHELIIVLIWVAVALSLLVLIQLAVVGALFLVLRTMLSRVWQIERKLRASGVDPYDLAGKSYRLLGALETATQESAAIGHSLNQGLAEVRSRLALVDQSMRHLLEQIEQASETLKHALAGPVIQLRLLLRRSELVLQLLYTLAQHSN